MYKHAHVCPLPKSGDPSQAANYRPVSLLPVASKVLEKIVHKQIVDHFERFPELKALPTEQFAYRRNHSCEDLLAYAVNKWQNSIDQNLFCGVLYWDMSKASDRVQHSKLLEELAAIGIGGKALCWFQDYLTGRSQQVVVGDSRRSVSPCTRGVPQGSVLGPLLFCIYIRHVPQVPRYSSSLLYADDITLSVTADCPATITDRLQTDLTLLTDHIEGRGLLLNASKTNFMVIRHPRKVLDNDLQLTCKGEQIAPVSTAKYLGVIIDEHLDFSAQATSVCDKAFAKVATFSHGRRNLAPEARRTFYISIVQSALEYASNAYFHSLSSKAYQKILTTSRICMKRIFGLSKFTIIT